MKESISVFILTILISFVGSIQIGPVNLAVIQTTLSRNFKAGIWVAFGGCLPEIIYATLAFKGSSFIQNNLFSDVFLKYLISPFFFCIGISSIFYHKKNNKNTENSTSKEFLKGFLLGIFNFQLLPFWIFVLLYLNSFVAINTFSNQSAFVFGAALGAFLILYFFALYTARYQSQICLFIQKYPFNKIIGTFFIILSIIQTIKIFS